MERPQLSTGVINQERWPTAGDVDDCWVIAALTALHASAPWEGLVSVDRFRAAAGNPDDPNQADGGTISQIGQALRTLYPRLNFDESVGEYDLGEFKRKVRDEGRPAVVFCISSALDPRFQYGFTGGHAVAVAFDGVRFRLSNPLAPAHTRWRFIGDAELDRVLRSWPGGGTYGVLMMPPSQAFTRHPLYSAPVQLPPDPALLEQARKDGFAAGVNAAVDAIAKLQA